MTAAPSPLVRREAESATWWLSLSVLLVTAILTIDLRLYSASPAPLAGLMIFGPLLACLRTSARATALVSGYTVMCALLVVLSTPDEDLVATGLLIPTVACGLWAVWAARKREYRNTILEQRRLQAYRSDLLARATGLLNNSLLPEITLQNVAQATVPSFCDLCIIDLVHGGRVERVAIVGRDEALTEQARRVSAAGEARLINGGEELFVEDYVYGALSLPDQLDEGQRAEVERMDLASLVSVPMHVRDELIGVITLMTQTSTRAFDQDDLGFARALASRAALAIEHARLFADRDRIAHTLQAALLPPSLPHTPGLDVAVAYRAAAADGATVGGDFYDAFARSDGRLLTALGDIQGKGIDAAIMSSLLHYTLRSAAQQHEDLCSLLGALNRALLDYDRSDRFCTLVLCEVTPTADNGARVQVALAGHPPAIVRRADGTVESLGSKGTLLGAVDAITCDIQSAYLERGDSVLLYSDGLIEARGPDHVLLGEDAFAQIVSDATAGSAAGLVGEVERRVREYAGVQDDDVCAVAVMADHVEVLLDREMRASASSVTAARHLCRDELARRDLHAPDLALVVSEAVANAVRYGEVRGVIGVQLSRRRGRLRLEVSNSGDLFDAVPRYPTPEEAHHRGLLLIDSLAECWGVRTVGPGRVSLWAELDVD